MTQTIPNPFKQMPITARLHMRGMMPTVWTALEAVWREGYMDQENPENLAILTTLMQVHEEVSSVLSKLLDTMSPEQAALLQSVLADGAFMAGVRLGQELAQPLVWAEAEDADA